MWSFATVGLIAQWTGYEWMWIKQNLENLVQITNLLHGTNEILDTLIFNINMLERWKARGEIKQFYLIQATDLGFNTEHNCWKCW